MPIMYTRNAHCVIQLSNYLRASGQCSVLYVDIDLLPLKTFHGLMNFYHRFFVFNSIQSDTGLEIDRLSYIAKGYFTSLILPEVMVSRRKQRFSSPVNCLNRDRLSPHSLPVISFVTYNTWSI